MKKICINQKKFIWTISYGSWGLITFGILLMLSISTWEISTITEEMGYYGTSFCYTNFFNGKICVDYLEWNYGNDTPSNHQFFFLLCMILDLAVIGWWIYHKQQVFKFGWCEKE